MRPSLDIIIVNWNAGEQLGRCVGSIRSAATASFRLDRVVVVDNASTDRSADALECANGRDAEVIRNARNLGFAAACNIGAEGSTADYILFLNPDTELGPLSIEPCIATLEAPSHERTGAVGAALYDDRGNLQRSTAHTPTALGLLLQSIGLDRLLPGLVRPHFAREWGHDETREVDQLMGAFLMVRRDLFAALGGFDERFFLYFEDVDLCERVRQAGLRLVHVAEARVGHRGCGTTAQIKARRLFYFQRSRIQYCAKHFGPGAAMTAFVAALTLEPAARMAAAVAGWRPKDVEETLAALGMQVAALPRTILSLLRDAGPPSAARRLP